MTSPSQVPDKFTIKGGRSSGGRIIPPLHFVRSENTQIYTAKLNEPQINRLCPSCNNLIEEDTETNEK